MKLKKALFLSPVFLLVISLLGSVLSQNVYAAAPQIRITEIMYDPLGNGDKEFIEIYNGSDSQANLGNWTFSNGVNYKFPASATLEPGKYGVIVRNSSVFRASYPNARVFGQYAGKLLGSGELIKIVDSGGSAVSQVDYRSGGGWPSGARNGGPSLSLIKANGDETSPSCWGTSTVNGGSPGFANSASGGGSCATKTYLATPVPQNNPQPSTNSNSNQSDTDQNTQNQPPDPNSPEAQQATQDQSLQNLTPEQLVELEQQAKAEDLEDSQDVTKLGSGDPLVKKLAGLGLGLIIITAGASYILLDKLRKHKNKHPIYSKLSSKLKKFKKKVRK